jgi:hypothetical protein
LGSPAPSATTTPGSYHASLPVAGIRAAPSPHVLAPVQYANEKARDRRSLSPLWNRFDDVGRVDEERAMNRVFNATSGLAVFIAEWQAD